jgi:hypothetical protein
MKVNNITTVSKTAITINPIIIQAITNSIDGNIGDSDSGNNESDSDSSDSRE